MPFQFSHENQIEFEELLTHYPIKEAAMLPTLHLAQKQHGYIDREVMRHVAELLEVPVMKVKNVVTFYPMFFEEPVGKYVIRVCHTLSCSLANCRSVLDSLRKKLKIEVASETDLAKGTTSDGKFTLLKTECLAACDVSPVMMVNDDLYKNLTPDRARKILDELE